MKKHLQFNDITALSLGWRAARRKAEKERRVEREKEQSSSSLLCIFIKENITSFPLLFSFFFFVFWLFCLTHLHFFSFLPFCPLFTSAFFSYCHGLISFFLSIVCPYSSILTIQFYLLRSCLSYNVSFFLCCTPSAIAHSQQDCRGIITFHFKALQICSLAFSLCPCFLWYLSFYFTFISVFSFTPTRHSTPMSNHWCSLSLHCMLVSQGSRTFLLKWQSPSLTPSLRFRKVQTVNVWSEWVLPEAGGHDKASCGLCL